MKKYLTYKNEMEGFKDVADTVRITEKQAASHIHFLKERVALLSVYKEAVQQIIGRLSNFYWDKNNVLLKKPFQGKKALVVFTGDRGIVGGLYHDLVNEVLSTRSDYDKILILGKKGQAYLAEEKIDVDFLPFSFDELPSAEKMREITDFFLEAFKSGEWKKIDILYSSFVSLAEQEPDLVDFLPFSFGEQAKDGADLEKNLGLPIFESNRREIFDSLLKKYINIFFSELIADAKLSEFSARTVAAESAVKETEKIIGDLNLDFLKERRRVITQKQVESFSVHQML